MILNDEQRMLRDTIADFLSREAPVDALRALRDADTDLAWHPHCGLVCELGAPAAAHAEDDGGLGFGWLGMGALMQEIGRTLCASPLLSSAIHAQALSGTAGVPSKLSDAYPR